MGFDECNPLKVKLLVGDLRVSMSRLVKYDSIWPEVCHQTLEWPTFLEARLFKSEAVAKRTCWVTN